MASPKQVVVRKRWAYKGRIGSCQHNLADLCRSSFVSPLEKNIIEQTIAGMQGLIDVCDETTKEMIRRTK